MKYCQLQKSNYVIRASGESINLFLCILVPATSLQKLRILVLTSWKIQCQQVILPDTSCAWACAPQYMGSVRIRGRTSVKRIGLRFLQIQDQKIKKLVSKNNWSGIGQKIGPTQIFPNMYNWSETNFIIDQSGMMLFW